MPIGRPSLYTSDLAAEICDRLMEGESLRAICRDPAMPSKAAVRLWVDEDRDGFAQRYARARELQAHAISDEILEIADDGSNDTYQTDEGEKVNFDNIQRSRLRVDARKWLLSKMLPKVYGDKSSIPELTALARSRL